VIVATRGKITKFRTRLFAALEQLPVQLRRAQNTLGELGKIVLEKGRRLQEAGRARENELRELLSSFLDVIVVTRGKITKYRSQLFAAFERATVQLRRAQKTLEERGKNALEKSRTLQEAGRARETDVIKLHTNILAFVRNLGNKHNAVHN
jgi:hypothetical protein